jgi:hypothetical protein
MVRYLNNLTTDMIQNKVEPIEMKLSTIESNEGIIYEEMIKIKEVEEGELYAINNELVFGGNRDNENHDDLVRRFDENNARSGNHHDVMMDKFKYTNDALNKGFDNELIMLSR